jgi:hypothetical protein
LGYYITIKNNLLEPKHIEKMGSSVWLYMWFIDKIMAINENGIGKVLNGRPIVYERVEADLGISRRTYLRWVKQLEDAKYIRTIRTPRGLTIYVNKAAKMWGSKSQPNNEALPLDEGYANSGTSQLRKVKKSVKNGTSDIQKMAHHAVKNGTSNSNNNNKTIVIDNKHAKKISQEKSEIGKLYYQVIKEYELPVTNHNVIWSKIRQWEKEEDIQKTINYLNFLLTQYKGLRFRYKPQISTALDIYSKRVKIKNALEDEIDNKNSKGVRIR